MEDRLRTSYCSARWCLVCNRIRTARYINAYAPIIEAWPDPHFVTLTIPNVPGGELRPAIQRMQNVLTRRCIENLRRFDRLDLQAVRKLECTYSLERGDYHPHFHLAVEGRDQALRLRERWLRQYPEAELAAQDVQKMRDGQMLELFKYMTKLTTRTPDGARCLTPPEALDVIFRALRRLHTLRPYGFTIEAQADATGEEEIEDLEGSPAFKRLGERVLWEWEQEAADWIDELTGEVLSEHHLSEHIIELTRSR